MADHLNQSSAISKPPLYVSTKNETVRMFDSDFMEFFSRVHPATPLILYLPVVGFMLYVALWRQHSGVSCRGIFLARYAPVDAARISDPPIHFPLRTENACGKTAALHHSRRASRLSKRREKACYAAEYQRATSIFFYGMFLLIFGRFASSAFAGLVFGYVCYDMLHYATHHFPMKRGALLWLKQYHLRHHYKDDHVGYGISSPLWDYVFRTTRR
jgi:hypothetical protein